MTLVSLPKAAKEAADRGDLLSAIKLTQETMGVGLQDAQQAVHAYVKDGQNSAAVAGSSGNSGLPEMQYAGVTRSALGATLPPGALTALSRGNVIEAIKHTRNASGLGLKEAKDAVDTYLARNPSAKRQLETAIAKNSVNWAPILSVFVLVLLAAGGFAAYVFLAKGQTP